MQPIVTPATLYTRPYAEHLAKQLNADEEDGWGYLVILAGEKAYVLIVDEKGMPVGTL